MAGTLFLDSLKKRETLKKGYPMGDGRVLTPDPTWFEKDKGEQGEKVGWPSNRDLYKVPSAVQKAIGRLREDIAGGPIDPEKQSKKNINNRLEAEESEGIVRNVSQRANPTQQAKRE